MSIKIVNNWNNKLGNNQIMLISNALQNTMTNGSIPKCYWINQMIDVGKQLQSMEYVLDHLQNQTFISKWKSW